MDTRRVIFEDELQQKLRNQHRTNRLGLLLIILTVVISLTVISILLVGSVLRALNTPQTVQVIYQNNYSGDENLLNVVLKPIKHFLTSAWHLMGFENDHKYRRKRDLDDENLIRLIDDNQLQKDVESDENVPKKDFGDGIDAALQRLVQKNLTLKIVYAPPGGEGNRNDIMRSMRKRRRRKRSTEVERNMRQRRYAQEYQELRKEYSRRCKKEAPDEKECSKYCKKFEQFLLEAKHSYKEIKQKLSGLLKECKGINGGDLKGDLSDSFPKRKDKKLIDKYDLESDETGKIKKKDKPKPTLVDQVTEGATLNEEKVTTVLTKLETTTAIGNESTSSEKPVVIAENNTQSHGKDVVTLTPILEETTPNQFVLELHEALEKFEENLIEEATWSVLHSKDSNISKEIQTTTASSVTSTEHNTQLPTLDDLIKSLNKTSTNTSAEPQPYNAQRHKPVEDDCIKSLDDLLKRIPAFRADHDENPSCNETTSATLGKPLNDQPEISKFKKQNLKYNPDEHRPKTDECIKTLDDLLAAVDMERGGMKKSKECKTTSSKTESDQQRSAFPDSIVDTLFEEYGRPPPPFHEDQLDQPKLPVEVHDFIMGRSRNRDQFNHDLPAPIESTDSRTFKYSSQPTVAASGPFLNLCDQLRSQQNPTPVKTLTSNQQHFQAQQFGALGQTSIPITGESHKATSQVLLNSAYGGFNPNHFCFYQVPPTYGAMRPVYAGGQSYPAGVMNVPVNIHNLPGRRTGDDADLDGAQLLCSLVVPPSTEKSGLGNDSVVLKATQDLDDVSMMTGARARGHHRHCPRGKVPCADGVQCVLSSHLCDSRVDCFDGSDETHCSCLSRLPEIRRCDGYVDCPLGEDEIGCFSCDKFSFSCFNTFFEFQASHHSETKCFTLIEKCDGFSNCLNGKDEQDCTMLVRDLRSPLAFTVGHSVGILHRNYKGKWYPVCHNPLSLAKEACEAELGPSHRDPVIVQHHGDLPGPFIQPNLRSHHVFQPEFTDTCNGLINYVKCPPPKCGSTKQSEMENVRIKIRGKRNASEILQIVGGTKAESGAYPFIVGIFRDGKFHCGSSIFNEHWIITAAHCCDNFHRHHYELRAGLLRRRSFSPHVQISTATHVLIHHGYSPQKMINDIALMHSDRPFQYNRWVRPICLPERHMTTNDRDWIWGPKPGTMCTAIGWGALVEHGGSPDHLMHVTVPILPFCKHKNDRDGLGICAAEMGGGHDACQGDSGGPFVCVSVSSPHEWYLAGVVSHGEGCARPNEPGVYTRVALFNEWIIKKTSEMLPPSNTRLTCPGFQCSFGVSYCIAKKKRCNGKVDCLGGEDELNCSLDQLLAESVKETSTVISLANRTTTSSTSTAVTGTTTPKIDFLAETSDQSSTTPYVTRPTTSTAPTGETVQVTTPRTDNGTLNVTHFRKITEAYTTEYTTAANMTTSTSDENSSSSEENEETTTTITQTVTSAMDANISNSTTESVTTSVSTTTSSTSTSTISEIKFSTLNYSAAISTEQTTSSPTVDYATITTNHTSYSISSTESSDVISSTEHYLKVDYSAVIEPTTETTLHTSPSEVDVTSVTETLSDKTNTTVLNTSTMSSVVDNNATTVNSYEADKTSESRYLESSTTETSVSFTTDSISSTTNQSDYFYNSTTKMSMSSNSPNTSRDSASDDLVGSSPTESPPDPSSTTTDSTSSTTAAHRDLEHSETQIETIETKAVHTTTDEHPFLSEIHQLVEKKNSRLKQFRLSMHYLHTSLKNQTTATNETVFRNKRFVCSKIHQSINIAHYCDRIIDCEDGTDEQRCTCRDYLTDKYDFLICDGKTDCLDLTDEENCFSCETGQYPCRMSKVCIDESKLCDTIPDCPLHEDELDCLALTDGNKVYFDANNLTEFKYEGLATKNTNGTWNLICGMQVDNKSVESIGKICSFLGFAGYRSYYQTVFEPLKNDTVDLEHQPLLIMSYRNISSEPQCKALHIACVPFINATEHEISHYENQHKEKPVQVNIRPVNPIDTMSTKPHITFHENDHIEFIENFGDDYDWPWNADIYLEGVFLCSAIIIDVNWIVVDSSCMRLINLKNDYLSVVTGGAKSYLKISGPYEQIVRVDCYHFLPEARVVMLHLEKNLTYTRHVLPTFIPEKSHNIEDNQCLAVGQDKYGRTRTLRVHINMTHCGHQPEKHICYQLDPNKGTYHADHCYTEGATRSGVVVCKTVLSGWYPVGFYLNKHGLCGFNEVVKMISLKEFYTDIQHVLGNKQCDYTFPEPLCDGMRCRYGKCIGHSLVCDNKMDCYDNSDERPEACNARNDTSTACLPTQFRCGEHQCVDKSKFCDGRNDCGDLSDEPHECSCYTYLKVTQPSTICDGIRNCWDKSDENPRLCKCTNSTFQCGDSEICVPYDHVCDGDNDCPGKEDEQFCYALQQNKAETNYGEVMQQTHGIWHSKCFPKNDKYDNQTIKEICNRIGYLQVRKVFGMKMLHESRLRTDNRTHDPVDRLRSAATKAVVLNQFSKVAINGKQKFFMKPSRPLFTLVNWDAEDEQNCDRLQISCEE